MMGEWSSSEFQELFLSVLHLAQFYRQAPAGLSQTWQLSAVRSGVSHWTFAGVMPGLLGRITYICNNLSGFLIVINVIFALCQVNKNFLEFFFLFHSVTAQIICSVDLVLTHAARWSRSAHDCLWWNSSVVHRLETGAVCDEWHFFLYCSACLSL